MRPFLCGWESPSRLNRLKERFHTENRQHPFEVVCQHMQTHLSAHMLEGFGLAVGVAHPGLQGPERMLDGCSSTAYPDPSGKAIDPALDAVRRRSF